MCRCLSSRAVVDVCPSYHPSREPKSPYHTVNIGEGGVSGGQRASVPDKGPNVFAAIERAGQERERDSLGCGSIAGTKSTPIA
jgi:hypothetical protein